MASLTAMQHQVGSAAVSRQISLAKYSKVSMGRGCNEKEAGGGGGGRVGTAE